MAFNITLLLALLLSGRCWGLRDVRVTVPAAILRGDTAVLLCHFDLEGESLYSVKWYKGGREFYRFTPKETPAMKVFPISGLEVEVFLCNTSRPTLRVLRSVGRGFETVDHIHTFLTTQGHGEPLWARNQLTSKHTHEAKKSVDATYAIKFSTTKYDYIENFATRAEYIPKLQRKKDEMA